MSRKGVCPIHNEDPPNRMWATQGQPAWGTLREGPRRHRAEQSRLHGTQSGPRSTVITHWLCVRLPGMEMCFISDHGNNSSPIWLLPGSGGLRCLLSRASDATHERNKSSAFSSESRLELIRPPANLQLTDDGCSLPCELGNPTVPLWRKAEPTRWSHSPGFPHLSRAQ